ncbi:MAG: putative acyltransferase [Acidimicrobiia bacterium]|nr:putative acyltransferase [Acidimicrobiia bacterium]
MTRVQARVAGRGLPSRLFYRFCRMLVIGFGRVWFRLSVSGRENVPTSGPFVVAPVHRSNLDTPLVGAAFPNRVRFMGKDSLWAKKMGGWFVTALGGFPVSRGSADREALKRCFEMVEGGEPVVLFAEGERKSGPLVEPLFDGAAYVAAKYRIPIIPVAVGGSERAMPKGAKFIRPHKIHIEIGVPITTADRLPATGRVPREMLRTLSAELHGQMQELFDRAQIQAGA